jgi:hypothetical protein
MTDYNISDDKVIEILDSIGVDYDFARIRISLFNDGSDAAVADIKWSNIPLCPVCSQQSEYLDELIGFNKKDFDRPYYCMSCDIVFNADKDGYTDSNEWTVS